MAKLQFTKMHGIGNDFVIIDAISQAVMLTGAQFRQIADRHLGVGCDQILLIERATSSATDFRYRIFNADGGEVAQCGNGARCFVRYIHDKGLSNKTEIQVETASGIITLKLESNGEVTVNMGAPRFAPEQIPFDADAPALTYELELAGICLKVSALSMGNPHIVQIVDDVDTAPVLLQGSALESHPRFPERVNAGYMQILDKHHVRLRVFERGSGETLACGTGACAAAVSGIRLGLLQSPVNVSMRGGNLDIRWTGEPMDPVWMTGPAVSVFEGELEI